jgi:RNA polymerase sigma factor for flagellar operon FliA
MSDRTNELIGIYHRGVCWAREATRLREEIVDKRAIKKEDDMFYAVGEWLERVRNVTAEELVSAIKKWYDNHFEDEIEPEVQAKLLKLQHNHIGDITATVKAFEKEFIKTDDVLISSYVADITAAWAKNKPYNMVLEKSCRFKPPTVEEQIASAEALQELMETNKTLVQHFVRKRYPTYHKSAEHEDISSEGMLGMLKSLIYYSPEISKLSTFVAPYILSAISDYITKKNFGTMHYQMRNKKYVAALDQLELRGIRNPTMTQVAQEMGVGLDAVQKLISVLQSANAVDMDSNEVAEIEDAMCIKPEEYVVRKESVDIVYNSLKRLPKDQRIVIRMLYYTPDGKHSSYKAIGTKLVEHYMKVGHPVTEIRKERIKQLRNKAMKSLREYVTMQMSETEHTLASNVAKIGVFPVSDIDEEMSHLVQCDDDESQLTPV